MPKCPRPLRPCTSCTLSILQNFSTRPLKLGTAQQKDPVVHPSPGQPQKTPACRRSLFPVSKSITNEPRSTYKNRLIQTSTACQQPVDVPPSDLEFCICQWLHPKLLPITCSCSSRFYSCYFSSSASVLWSLCLSSK